MSKVFIWANSDLDGVGSVILLGHVYKDIEYCGVFFGDFESKFLEWREENYDKYAAIFVIGMPLDQSLVNKLDDKKVIFVSDRKEDLKVYESKLLSEECTSCSKLLFKKFSKNPDKAIPQSVKEFIVYVDDYNSYKLKTSEAKYINAIYRKSGSKRFYNFINRFWDGYDGLSDKETNTADLFFKEISNELQNLELYKGTFKGFSVVATFSKMSVNEIAASLLEVYSPDVVIVVNIDTQFVSFRKREGSSADVKFMAENLCGGGGGEYASGGKMGQKFIDYTKELSPYAI